MSSSFDQTSFGKFVLKGRDALAVLQRLCANEIDVPVGKMVYTAMLNARGGFESDLTVIRSRRREFFIVTGSAQTTRDAAWIERHIDADEHAALVDVTGGYSVISVMGPKAEALLGRLSSDDLSKAGMPFAMTQEIDVGHARVRAARMSYVGGPGYELYVTADQCVTLYDALTGAGGEFGLRDAGYYTIDALRIEAGRRAWGAELSPDETPWEAGLAFAVKMDKPAPFIGRDALVRDRRPPITKRLVLLSFDDSAAFPWGGEPMLMNGASVGEITSAGYSRRHGRALAMGIRAHRSPADRRGAARRALAGRHRRRARSPSRRTSSCHDLHAQLMPRRDAGIGPPTRTIARSRARPRASRGLRAARAEELSREPGLPARERRRVQHAALDPAAADPAADRAQPLRRRVAAAVDARALPRTARPRPGDRRSSRSCRCSSRTARSSAGCSSSRSLFFSSLAFTVLENAMSVIFLHRVKVRRRPLVVSLLIPFCYILFLAVGLLLVSLVAGALQAMGTREHRFSRPHGIARRRVSRVLLYLIGVAGEILMLTSIYLVMPVGRLRSRTR